MTLHLARSDGGKGSREKCDDQMIFPVILVEIGDQPILRGWEREVKGFFSDQRFFLCREAGDGKKK
jgi:hypothetical protein